jgi:hypothetical protein
MKAREENNEIKIYHRMPRSWDGVNYYAGDFHLQSDDVHKEEGFYPVVRPEFDPDIEKLGDIYFDTDKFTYPVEELELDLEEVKQQKLLELRTLMEIVQNAARPYLDRLDYLGEETPQDFKTKSSQLYGLFDQHKAAINNETDAQKVVKYALPYAIAEAAAADLRKLI